ncbi:MAG: aspartate-semialdehyde dehydrogenase [Pseudomonadota bacterium]
MNPGKKEGYVFVVVGATGAVGREILSILAERKFPVRELRAIGSERSVGHAIEFQGKTTAVRALDSQSFVGADIAFFTAGSNVSKEYVPVAARSGAVVVDNTSAFRMDPDVPLAVPEVNPEVLRGIPSRRIISVPNCTTVQLVVALAPLHKAAKIRRIVVSTYQATSGAGRRAMEELSRQVQDLFHLREVDPDVFPHRIAFNLIPEIGGFHPDGMSIEEKKICLETQKILSDPSIGVSATSVRVPTFHGHAESINIETEKPLSAEEARKILADAPGVTVVDDPGEHEYPLISDSHGEDAVLVGRIRNDPSRANCLNLWVVADNLRKGAALNGIQILESLIANGAL